MLKIDSAKRSDVSDLHQQYLETLDMLKRQEKKLLQKLKTDPSTMHDLRIIRSERRSVETTINMLDHEYVRRDALSFDPQVMDKIALKNWGRIAAQYVSYMDRHPWDDESQAHETPLPEKIVDYTLKSQLTSREYACILAYERGMTQDEIAGHLGVSRTSVQSYILRARKKLAESSGIQVPLWTGSEEEPQIL